MVTHGDIGEHTSLNILCVGDLITSADFLTHIERQFPLLVTRMYVNYYRATRAVGGAERQFVDACAMCIDIHGKKVSIWAQRGDTLTYLKRGGSQYPMSLTFDHTYCRTMLNGGDGEIEGMHLITRIM